jgi:hypothetical protein
VVGLKLLGKQAAGDRGNKQGDGNENSWTVLAVHDENPPEFPGFNAAEPKSGRLKNLIRYSRQRFTFVNQFEKARDGMR